MADKTKIEWTDATWNPIDGCTPVSEGCQNCYAANMAKRFWGDRKFSDIRFHQDRLKIPLKWKKPRMIFVSSMGDLFHQKVKTSYLNPVFTIMAKSWEMNLGHIFIILTKRPGKMKKYVQEHRNLESAICYQETSNIWFGVTAENQKRADDRIPILLEIPAAVRFVSVEPMLERVTTLSRHIDITNPRWVDWVICGAETGPGARRMRKQWAIDLYKECKCGNVPFFFKKPSKGDEIDLPREFPVEQQ